VALLELPDSMTGLQLSDWVLLVVAPFIASFLGVVIRRLPEGRPLVWARSGCEACGTTLAPSDLVPLVSWVMLGRRCRYCGHVLSWFYPGVELAALVVAIIAIGVDGSERAWLDCLLGWWLLTLGWIDLRHWLLPDLLTLPLLVTGLGVTAAFDVEDLADHAAGAVVGYLGLLAAAEAYRLLRGRKALGAGDAKLLGAAGAWLGVAALPQVVLLAALTALAAAAGLSLAGIRLHAPSALPFGAFLALAIWSVWLFGPVPL